MTELPLLFYSTARTVHFTLQFQLLQTLGAIGGALPRSRKPRTGRLGPLPYPKHTEVRDDLIELLRQDSRNIAGGLYPLSVLKPESPIAHLRRLPGLMADGLAIFARRDRGRTTEFTREASEELSDLPRYYRRCFHFQTDGYLSDRSASLYEHQVEMLFRGSADAMRRLILPRLRERFGSGDGRGLKFLEIGAGTGRATQFVQQTFPRARIVATDLSSHYLAHARRQLSDARDVDFLQAAGEKLPFPEGHFDAVYSVFLFHELPMEARREILAESMRVLKSGGFCGLVDSIQTGDHPPFDPLLERFPAEYHEPYFRDYAAHPMQELFAQAGFTRVENGRGFFSKWVTGAKT